MDKAISGGWIAATDRIEGKGTVILGRGRTLDKCVAAASHAWRGALRLHGSEDAMSDTTAAEVLPVAADAYGIENPNELTFWLGVVSVREHTESLEPDEQRSYLADLIAMKPDKSVPYPIHRSESELPVHFVLNLAEQEALRRLIMDAESPIDTGIEGGSVPAGTVQNLAARLGFTVPPTRYVSGGRW